MNKIPELTQKQIEGLAWYASAQKRIDVLMARAKKQEAKKVEGLFQPLIKIQKGLKEKAQP